MRFTQFYTMTQFQHEPANGKIEASGSYKTKAAIKNAIRRF